MVTSTLEWILFKDKLPEVGLPIIIMHNDGYMSMFMMWAKMYRTKAYKQWAYLPDTGWATKK